MPDSVSFCSAPQPSGLRPEGHSRVQNPPAVAHVLANVATGNGDPPGDSLTRSTGSIFTAGASPSLLRLTEAQNEMSNRFAELAWIKIHATVERRLIEDVRGGGLTLAFLD